MEINQMEKLIKKQERAIVEYQYTVSLLQKLTQLPDDKMTELEIEIEKFKTFVKNDYINFSNKDDIKNDAELYDKLLNVIAILERMNANSLTIGCNILVIGGGFSSGKSSFINSLLGSEMLASGTLPTTSVPTYVLHETDKDTYKAYTKFGTVVALSEKEFKSITHSSSNKNEGQIHLTNFIDNLTVNSESFRYDNIILLDTPGYTNVDFHTKADMTDIAIAKRQMELADTIIWLIDIENGTIQQSDLEFLRNLDNKKAKKYFIANKADKKMPSEITAIVQQIKKTLDNNHMQYEGILAYSSHDTESFDCVGKDINTFLKECNTQTSNNFLQVENEISFIFTSYEEHFREESNYLKNIIAILNKVVLSAEDSLSEQTYSVLQHIKKKAKLLKSNEAEYFEIKEKINTQLSAISHFFGITYKEPKIVLSQTTEETFDSDENFEQKENESIVNKNQKITTKNSQTPSTQAGDITKKAREEQKSKTIKATLEKTTIGSKLFPSWWSEVSAQKELDSTIDSINNLFSWYSKK